MAFHDVLLPDGFQYASNAGPGFATIVQQSASGHEVRIARQSQALHRLSLIKALQTPAEAKALKSFALERRGALHSFKVRDFSDFTSASDGETAPTNLDQVLGTGDGATTQFQLVKRYGYLGPNEYTRTITLPVSGSVVCALNASPTTSFTVSSTGVVTFTTAPGIGVVVTAGFQFYVPVRFSLEFDKWARLQADAFQVWSLPLLDVQEVASEVEQPERWSPGGSRDWGNVGLDIALAFNDGKFHHLNPTAAINVYLPPPGQQGSGPEQFTISVAPGSGFNVQLRDDAGATVGAAWGSGGDVRRVHLLRNSSGATTWILAA
jgi:uncharacterized protein (TIGR02217 family)